MKTLTEAIEVFAFMSKTVNSPEEMEIAARESVASSKDLLARNAALSVELQHSDIYQGLVHNYLDMICSSSDDEQEVVFTMRSALLSMFMAGLVVGMEMEKQEVVL